MSARVIAALRRRADVLETDADTRAGLSRHITTISAAMTVSPGLLQFLAAEFRELADEAEGAS
jgi:hypothetical protein